MNTDVLFGSIRIGNVEVKNRFVMPAIDTGMLAETHEMTETFINYAVERTKGGYGLQIIGYMAVDPEGLSEKKQGALWDDSFIAGSKKLVDKIHEENGVVFAQLQHAGIYARRNITGMSPRGPVDTICAKTGEQVIGYTNQEVYQVIERYVSAAVRARKAGYDGVELHAAHGFQIAQFLSIGDNKRLDEFGGNYRNRFRFVQLILDGIRKQCGEDYPVGIRFSADEYRTDGGIPQDTYLYAKMAEDAGAAYIHVTAGSTGTSTDRVVAPYFVRPAFNEEHAYRIKQAVHIPVIVAGRINDVEVAADIVSTGKADMVTLGRQSICDPEFPKKVMEHREDEIFRCTGCMQRCFGAKPVDADDHDWISCLVNPFTGKENEWKIEPAVQKKKIAIIGAGPAGLNAAWILAKRGHKVTVYEKASLPGGAYRIAAIPPKKQDLAGTIYTYLTLGKKYGVTYNYNCNMDDSQLKSVEADVIILATGSVPFIPNIKGLDREKVCLANDVLDGKHVVCNEKVLILGGGLVGCETAEFLKLYHNDITIVDMLDVLAKEAPKYPRKALLEELETGGVVSYTSTKVTEILPDGVKAEREGKEIVLDGFEHVIFSMGARNNNPLENSAREICNEVYVIGDALRARDAKVAIYEAAKLAIRI